MGGRPAAGRDRDLFVVPMVRKAIPRVILMGAREMRERAVRPLPGWPALTLTGSSGCRWPSGNYARSACPTIRSSSGPPIVNGPCYSHTQRHTISLSHSASFDSSQVPRVAAPYAGHDWGRGREGCCDGSEPSRQATPDATLFPCPTLIPGRVAWRLARACQPGADLRSRAGRDSSC